METLIRCHRRWHLIWGLHCLPKPADLDLHSFQKNIYQGLAWYLLQIRTPILIKGNLNAAILTEYKSVVFIHV